MDVQVALEFFETLWVMNPGLHIGLMSLLLRRVFSLERRTDTIIEMTRKTLVKHKSNMTARLGNARKTNTALQKAMAAGGKRSCFDVACSLYVYTNILVFFPFYNDILHMGRAFGSSEDNFVRTWNQKSLFESLVHNLIPTKMRTSASFLQSGIYRFGIDTVITTCLLLHILNQDCTISRLEMFCYPVCLRIRRRRAAEMESEYFSTNSDKSAVNDLIDYYLDKAEESVWLNDLISNTGPITFDGMETSCTTDHSSFERESSDSEECNFFPEGFIFRCLS